MLLTGWETLRTCGPGTAAHVDEKLTAKAMRLETAGILDDAEQRGHLQVLSSETEETLGGFFRFHADCSNTWQRKTSVAYAADFETGEDPEEVSERVMDVRHHHSIFAPVPVF